MEPFRRAAPDALLTYQMPDELLAIASAGEFDEFDLNAFFEASGTGAKAQFKHQSDVQKWLDIIRGGYLPNSVELLKTGRGCLSRTRRCACRPTSSIGSGSYLTWRHATRWRTGC